MLKHAESTVKITDASLRESFIKCVHTTFPLAVWQEQNEEKDFQMVMYKDPVDQRMSATSSIGLSRLSIGNFNGQSTHSDDPDGQYPIDDQSWTNKYF